MGRPGDAHPRWDARPRWAGRDIRISDGKALRYVVHPGVQMGKRMGTGSQMGRSGYTCTRWEGAFTPA